MYWLAVGLTAAILTMFAFVPQIIKVLKTKSVRDVSITTLLQLCLGVSLWIAYGVHLKDKIIITANSVTLITVIILLWLYFNFRRQKK
jgi:MtN3 and saliva related transmembrane protein